SLENKYNIVKSIGEECIHKEELWNLLKKKKHPICYDGFEPSRRMHIAQVKIVVADWFAKLNNKMDTDMKKIRVVGEYMIEIWKAAGMKLENVEFLWSSDEINKRAHEYWHMEFRVLGAAKLWDENDDLTAAQIFYPLMQFADVFFLKGVMKMINVNKLTFAGCEVKIVVADWFAKKTSNSFGLPMRSIKEHMNIGIWVLGAAKLWDEKDDLTAAQIFYPLMQFADVFFLKADICQLGMDQRKVNVLAKEYCDVIKRKNKPIILSHQKMSKFDSSSVVFMEDKESKIKKAYCPPRIVEGNPCLEYIKYIVFLWFNKFNVERKMENGGSLTLMKNLLWIMQKVTCILLKPALSHALNKILQPVHDHFETDKDAKDLLKKVKGYKATK
nr:tyrosine--tRNA ligase 1, cytoplasmic-like [Tanacetum cinerariifolium]